jgi:hypothetical protein
VHFATNTHAVEAIGGNKKSVIYLDETTGRWAAELFLAVRLWNILFGPISIANVNPIYRQPGRASSKEEFSRRTTGATRQI